MLDLQARVHLEEIILLVAIEHELARTGVDIADRRRGAHGRGTHLCAQLRRERDRRRLLDNLLMPALNRTLAFAEMNRASMRIGEHLKLDVPRIAKISFQEYGVVAECSERFAFGCSERFIERGERFDHAHPATTAARTGFDQEREADCGRFLLQALGRLVVAVVAGHGRHVEARTRCLASILLPIAASHSAAARPRSSPRRCTLVQTYARSERKP